MNVTEMRDDLIKVYQQLKKGEIRMAEAKTLSTIE